jgi:WD40 repeat protein
MQHFFTLSLLFLLLTIFSFSKEIKPAFTLKTQGLVNDFVLDGIYLYVGTDDGLVEIFNIQTRKKVDEIFITAEKSAMGDWINPKVLSVDRNKGKTLIVSSSTGGYRNVWIHDGQKLKRIISTKKKISIKEARFIDSENILYGTLSYDVANYALGEGYRSYSNQIEQSTFSDMVLSEDKKSVVAVSESGQVSIMDVKTGKVLKQPKPLNLDNIYKVDYKNGNIITAGQDRRVGVYPKDGKPYSLKSDFLVYCVGLSPSGNIGVYSANEENDLQLFDLKRGTKTHLLVGQDSVPSNIKFFDEDGFFSAGYGYTIYYWYLKD